MRPHVEFVHENDLLWHMAELPHGVGDARQKNLSYDEEDGSASLRVTFFSDWSRPSGLHAAMTEWYVLKGEICVGETVLNEGDYWCAPKGVLTPELSAKEGTEVLLFREYGDWNFTLSNEHAPDKSEQAELVIKRTGEMDWYDVEDPVNGSPMDFSRGGTPVPGLFIKLLYRDPDTGFYTRLIKAKPEMRNLCRRILLVLCLKRLTCSRASLHTIMVRCVKAVIFSAQQVCVMEILLRAKRMDSPLFFDATVTWLIGTRITRESRCKATQSTGVKNFPTVSRR